jgi:hypothetical protein
MGQAAKQLGYAEAPGYFDAGRFDALPHNELRYGCRKAKETSGLQGVYLLRDSDGRNHIPIVFLCEAETEGKAREIHRQIWNLNLVPFVVIETPTRLRAYQGFSYEADPQKKLSFAEASLADVAEILDQLAAFRAEAIDKGQVFEKWGHKITPKERVDEHLLRQLKLLDARLRQMGLPRDPSHCLIGKYVWLSYLRARGILSDWRLDKAVVERADVFGRNAKLTAFYKLDEYLQGWLNGEIFPLHGENLRAVKSEHLQKVAGIFAGDEANGQMAMFTDLYDFSHLPIETLSVVYEQFLHHKEEGDETSEGEESGAYYTPICLAEFMIEEMDRKLPLRDGVAVFDPACGSGAFLVQAYRRLVERTMAQEKRDLKLTEVRAMLKENIFGVDRDPDACRVARMSLAIALLDYADPPDVSGPMANFQLPTLAENNVREKDFFELDPSWPRAKDKQPPQWIIGNPPWVELKSSKRAEDKRNKPAWDWFSANKAKHPTSGNQIAEAFVWRVRDFSRPDSVIGLVVPAMTLFKHEAQKFRRAVFSQLNVWCVTNFANLAYVLFAGVDKPAACLFYQPSRDETKVNDEPIITFAPFVAEQGANLPSKPGEQLETWNILVRAQDWREIDRRDAEKGARLTWKLAMWGSQREARLLRRLEKFPRFEQMRKEAGLLLAAGPELRRGPGNGLSLFKELVGKRVVSFRGIRGSEAFFGIPANCLSEPLEEASCYLRDRGGRKGLSVCHPPHVLINKGRRFAVFSNDFLVVPPGENAIYGENVPLLKALAVYLISSVARWHQFFISSEWGISTSIARLEDLEALPVPFSHQDTPIIQELAKLYDELADDDKRAFSEKDRLVVQLETIFPRLFGLRTQEREIIEGFFASSYQCIKGKFPVEAVEPVTASGVLQYCQILRRELDNYLQERGVRHQITVSLEANDVCLTIQGKRTNEAIEPVIQKSNNGRTEGRNRMAQHLQQKHSQWVYFEKSLYFYDRAHGRMMFLKPRRRIEWNVRQALLDGDDLIAELVSEHD